MSNSESLSLATRSQLAAELVDADTPGETAVVHFKLKEAQELARRLRLNIAEQVRVTCLRIRAELKLGDYLLGVERATPGRPSLNSSNDLTYFQQTLDNIGTTRQNAARWQTIASWPDAEHQVSQWEAKADRIGDEWKDWKLEVSSSKLYRLARDWLKEQDDGDITFNPTPREGIRLLQCAVADLAAELTEPVDLIFTDPPYGLDHLDTWEGLAAFASARLKPGGLLIAYSGQLFLPEVMYALTELNYVWMGSVVHDGSFFELHQHKIHVGWKPLLIYSNGPPTIKGWWNDTVDEGHREKAFHEWQQSEAEAAHMIVAHSNEGDLVVDPFVGGGTTAVAAMRTGRRCVGADTDTKALRRTGERLAAE